MIDWNHPENKHVLHAIEHYASIPRKQDDYIKQMIDDLSIAAFGIVAIIAGSILFASGVVLWILGVLGLWSPIIGGVLFVLSVVYFFYDRVNSRRRAEKTIIHDRLVLGFVIDLHECLYQEPGSWGPAKVLVNCDPNTCLDPSHLLALGQKMLNIRSGQEPSCPELISVLRSQLINMEEIDVPREVAGHDYVSIKSFHLKSRIRPNKRVTTPLVAILYGGNRNLEHFA